MEIGKKEHHVIYEIFMYKETYFMLSELRRLIDEYKKNSRELRNIQILINMTIESHMIHLRNLIYFFEYKDSKFRDDIVYSEFIADKNSFNKEPINNIDAVVEIINKTISHLTEVRTKGTAKSDQQKAINDTFPHMVKTINEYEKFRSNIKGTENEFESSKSAPKVIFDNGIDKNRMLTITTTSVLPESDFRQISGINIISDSVLRKFIDSW